MLRDFQVKGKAEAYERHKRWTKANPEAAKAIKRRYYAKTIEARREEQRLFRLRNPEHVRARAKKWRDKNPEKVRNYKRKDARLPIPTRPEPALCELCGRHPSGAGSLHLDHDHVTGLFRGWLCHHCNTGIGLLGDDYESVLRAAEYLKNAS